MESDRVREEEMRRGIEGEGDRRVRKRGGE